MCGIAGQTGRRDDALVQRMANAIAHRGPDAEGFYHDDHVSLGHRRLSIIDLNNGAQPMSTVDGRHHIVFNGEIYNYRELRAELEACGRIFATQSDTETILQGYAEWGTAVVARLRGMFAFALWDAHERTALLARDPLGIKPLYYAEHGGVLLFGSEIPALLEARDLPRDMDFAALDDYLSLLYTVPPRTMFRAIRQLPPGHTAEWHAGTLRVERYWSPPAEEEDRPEAEWIEIIGAALEESIRAHRISDVPIGAYLSGGLDSTAIAWHLSQAGGEPLRTFTIGFTGEGRHYDESAEACAFARQLGTRHHAITVDANVVEIFPQMVRHFGEPFGNPTALLSYALAKAVRPHVKVVLSGDGGDEIFGGYPRYKGMRWAKRFRAVPRPLRAAIIDPLLQCLPESTRGLHALRRIKEFSAGSLLPPEACYAQWVGYYTPAERAVLYTPATARAVGPHDGLSFVRDLYSACPLDDPAARAMHADASSFLPGNVLQYGDRMSMAHGLEARVPFADVRLLETLFRVPAHLKLRGGHAKYLLRRCLEGKVPREIAWRKKTGFNPPMGVWLNTALRPLVEDYLSPAAIRERGLFEPGPVQGMLAAHRAGRRDLTWHLWSLLVLEEWHRQFID